MVWLIILIAVGLMVGLPFLAYARFVEPFRPRLRHETLELEDLPPGLDGLTILHVSDLHLTNGSEWKAEVLRQVTGVEVDIVALTGDFIETDDDIDFCIEAISGLRARYGVFGVLGNHDYLGDKSFFDAILKRREQTNNVRLLIQKLEAAGVRVLMNESHAVAIDGQKLWVVGVDDPHKERHDLGRALRDVPRDAYKLLLAHSPEVVDQLPGHPVNLILSGHTHGGQIVLPLLGALMTRTRYPLRPASGWRRVGRAWMNVTRGIGGSLPLRLGCPPEAHLIQLKARPRVPFGRAISSEVTRQHFM